jgi:polyribonucleotide nucleotidyltransferase
MAIHNAKIALGQGTPLEIETGKFAKLADGAVTVRLGDTIVLVTAVSATKVKDGQDFFPLSVEYKEKASAAGRFPGGYFKREGRPTEKEILTCRMTDRPLRPLFPKGYYYDTQVVAILLSADGVNDPDICAINGASAALCVSDIPFAGPVAAVRIGRLDGQFIINPTQEQRLTSELDLVYGGSKTEVIMIEGAAEELPEADFVAALHFAQEAIQPIIKAQEEMAAAVGKAKREVPLMLVKDELLEIAYAEGALYTPSKVARGKAVGALKDEVAEAIKAKFPEATGFEVSQAFDYLQKKAFRISILDKKSRCDGRGLDDLRQLSGETSVLPRTHGSASFTRGETMALSIATLAPADEAQEMDTYAGGPESKRFILHYNFPPFSVGETGRFGGQNRREIGHGALAERSVAPVIPSKEDFPYAIRISSEVMESNGSTSMASVCSGVMALMDAGVPIKRPVGGISVGLVSEFEGETMSRYLTMLDIIGSEDHFGDMDFKLCGTSEGVTGFQLDLKLPGLPMKILEEAIVKAKTGRTAILSAMNAAISEIKPLSPYAPRIEVVKISPDKIGELIGPGGKNIKAIQAESGAEISIEDDGTVYIYANRKESLDRAVEMINGNNIEIEIGKIYTGKVVSTTNFGAFMNLGGKKDGLIHISELADFRVNRTEDVVKTGDIVTAKCVGIDDKGRVKMSRKAAMKEKAAAEGGEAAPAEVAAE